MATFNQFLLPSIEGYHPPRQKRSLAKVDRIKKALITLLESKSFKDISTIEIAETAAIKNVQSLYQYFEDGKSTIISLLGVECHLRQQAVLIDYFSQPEQAQLPLADLVRGLNQSLHHFYREHPEWVTVLHDPDIPLSLRVYRDLMRYSAAQLGADFLKARGYGHNRHVLALMINDVMYFIHEKSVTLNRQGRQLEVKIDQELETELETMIIRYLAPIDPLG